MSTAILALVPAVVLYFGYRSTRISSDPTVLHPSIPSPRNSLLPGLKLSQASALAYPPNLIPGARDVDTPYGSMRVYEWGPMNGKKVLLIHGDSTPAPMLAPIAEALANQGCRVLIFDLWGRGYSDSPLRDPHDAALFGNQIFYAFASSPISWTGQASDGFSIVAFSLGASIAMSFVSHFPYLVNSIVLLAPGGLLRTLPKGYTSSLFPCRRFIPSGYLRKLVAEILGAKQSEAVNTDSVPKDITTIASLSSAAITQWQFDFHEGIVHSFIDTILHGPLMHQHSDWKKVCSIINGESPRSATRRPNGRLVNSKILVVFGDEDGVVVGKDVSADLTELLGGPEHLVVRYTSGGHGFPIPQSEDVIKYICEFWGL
ncbi:MAG: hypothetical protein Q9219_004492 [cf. Caloplaca sp. 3 TL-2023]